METFKMMSNNLVGRWGQDTLDCFHFYLATNLDTYLYGFVQVLTIYFFSFCIMLRILSRTSHVVDVVLYVRNRYLMVPGQQFIPPWRNDPFRLIQNCVSARPGWNGG